jgi:hypothetical protein
MTYRITAYNVVGKFVTAIDLVVESEARVVDINTRVKKIFPTQGLVSIRWSLVQEATEVEIQSAIEKGNYIAAR